jgi:hypothetical protein
MGYLWELIILLHHNMMGGLTMAMMGQEFKEVQETQKLPPLSPLGHPRASCAFWQLAHVHCEGSWLLLEWSVRFV